MDEFEEITLHEVMSALTDCHLLSTKESRKDMERTLHNFAALRWMRARDANARNSTAASGVEVDAPRHCPACGVDVAHGQDCRRKRGASRPAGCVADGVDTVDGGKR